MSKSIKAVHRQTVTETFKRLCFYCERPTDEKRKKLKPTMDHFWPRARKGCNSTYNLVLACAGCNTKKADREPTIEEFYRLYDIRPGTTVENFFHYTAEFLTPEEIAERRAASNRRKKERRKVKIIERLGKMIFYSTDYGYNSK